MHQMAVFVGKKGCYAIEFYDHKVTVEAKASGPIPFGEMAGMTSIVARATGTTAAEARRMVIDDLEKGGF